MSKCVQFRRGSADQHEDFTGAIGEVTMDTTNNTLRVHDGETAGGTVLAKKSEIPADIMTADYVTETWRASDGSSWYRKYKSGWVEQGGYNNINLSPSGANTEIELPLEMLDSNYSCSAILTTRYGGRTIGALREKFTTTHVVIGGYNTINETVKCIWQICGMSE